MADNAFNGQHRLEHVQLLPFTISNFILVRNNFPNTQLTPPGLSNKQFGVYLFRRGLTLRLIRTHIVLHRASQNHRENRLNITAQLILGVNLNAGRITLRLMILSLCHCSLAGAISDLFVNFIH